MSHYPRGSRAKNAVLLMIKRLIEDPAYPKDFQRELDLSRGIFTRTWEMSFKVAENENSRVGSKPSAHVKPDETLSLSRASLPPF